jgi:hypothetical protein
MFLFYSGDTKYVTRVLVYKPAASQVQGIRYTLSGQTLLKNKKKLKSFQKFHCQRELRWL